MTSVGTIPILFLPLWLVVELGFVCTCDQPSKTNNAIEGLMIKLGLVLELLYEIEKIDTINIINTRYI